MDRTLEEKVQLYDEFVKNGFQSVDDVLESIKKLNDEKFELRHDIRKALETASAALKAADTAVGVELSPLSLGLEESKIATKLEVDMAVIKQSVDLPGDAKNKEVVEKIEDLKDLLKPKKRKWLLWKKQFVVMKKYAL